MLVVGGLAGCNLKEKYARNNLAAGRWLQANRRTANINVEGAWEAWESGWGEIRFEQVGSTVFFFRARDRDWCRSPNETQETEGSLYEKR